MDFSEYSEVVQGYMEAAVAEIKSSGRWRDVDMISMDILAASLEKWRKAEADIRSLGISIGTHANPSVSVASQSLRLAMGIMQDYGLTALSKKKLTRGEPAPEDDTPIESFLNGD
jgi:phage terminase small subunit